MVIDFPISVDNNYGQTFPVQKYECSISDMLKRNIQDVRRQEGIEAMDETFYIGEDGVTLDEMNKDDLDKTTPSVDFEDSYFNRFVELQAKFLKELDRIQNVDVEYKDSADNAFYAIIPFIAAYEFDKSSVELTRSRFLKVSLRFPKNTLVIITKPFEVLEDVSENQIIYSIFIDRELIATNVLEKSEFNKGFKEFLHLYLATHSGQA